MQERKAFSLCSGFCLDPSSTASSHIFHSAAGVRERENHTADDSKGGALDMCCSERLPGESSQHQVPQSSKWRRRAPDGTGAGGKPGWL